MRSQNKRQDTAYSRRRPVREPYARVLIVCEGEKTEPNYLRGLQREQGLSSVNINVVSPPNSDPLSLVRFAIQALTQDPDLDCGYCVFDRDQHANFGQALDLIAKSSLGVAGKLSGITSTPCFELWLLLHFRYSTMSYIGAGGASACDRLISDLRAHFPTYVKAHKDVYGALADRVQDALENAEALGRHNESTGSANPGTEMHRLVRYLTSLKKR
ncbi:MAG: RloB domain-containing protein [Alphaproteobacteria bacterium]|nr:RloB domain-containing protein [Alphaproteobacteria bacterium]